MIHWQQLTVAGASSSTISRWAADGYLHLVYPRVYAVGHNAPSVEGDLVAAVLYGGPGAMLSHETAAWWWGLTDREPGVIDVSTPRVCRSLPGQARRAVRVHSRRHLPRVWQRHIAVTTVAQALLDFASVASFRRVRQALAELDYRRALDLDAIEDVLGRGKPGCEVLRRAIDERRPEFAYTRSEFERRFLELCEAAGLPIPKFNVKVCGLKVDALWREQHVIVELDGVGNHATPAQVARDHERDLRLRAAGYTVLRYTWGQITRRRALIVADVRRALRLPLARRATTGPG